MYIVKVSGSKLNYSMHYVFKFNSETTYFGELSDQKDQFFYILQKFNSYGESKNLREAMTSWPSTSATYVILTYV